MNSQVTQSRTYLKQVPQRGGEGVALAAPGIQGGAMLQNGDTLAAANDAGGFEFQIRLAGVLPARLQSIKHN